MTDTEWLANSAPLPEPFGRERPEMWHIGKSGQEIFLTDYVSERTWTLFKGIEFNYTTSLQVVRAQA